MLELRVFATESPWKKDGFFYFRLCHISSLICLQRLVICVGTNQGEKCEGGKENNHTDENLLRRKGFEVLLETKVDIKHWKVIEKEYQIGFTYPEAKGYKFPS